MAGYQSTNINKLAQNMQVPDGATLRSELNGLRQEIGEIKRILAGRSQSQNNGEGQSGRITQESVDLLTQQLKLLQKTVVHESTLGMGVDDLFYQTNDLKNYLTDYIGRNRKSNDVYYWILIIIGFSTLFSVTYIGAELLGRL